MKILWERGESAVGELVAAMPDGAALAYNSVLTTIRILEQKGYVRHRQEGRAFLYSPCVAEQEASRSEIRHMMQRFFGNSRERLLLSLLGDDEVTPEELQRLKEAIAAAADDRVGDDHDADGSDPYSRRRENVPAGGEFVCVRALAGSCTGGWVWRFAFDWFRGRQLRCGLRSGQRCLRCLRCCRWCILCVGSGRHSRAGARAARGCALELCDCGALVDGFAGAGGQSLR